MKTLILIIGVLAVVACGVVGFVFLRRSRELTQAPKPAQGSPKVPNVSKATNPELKQSPKTKKFWAVYVVDHPANAQLCDAVKKLHFRHFGQTQQLPSLPLKDCDRKESCKCFHREVTEKRRAQRRVARDRREEFRFTPGKPEKVERRKFGDRRAARTEWEGYDTDR